jgi:putative transposase
MEHGKWRGSRTRKNGDKTPLSEEVQAQYDPSKEHIQDANYYLEMKVRKLKGSL